MFYFEMQGFTWRARCTKQQDALLINSKVIQHQGLLTQCYQLRASKPWCVAVADGVASSPKAEKASVAVLEAVHEQQQTNPNHPKKLSQIQHDLAQRLTNSTDTHSSSSTLALVQNGAPEGSVTIQHLGDSRVYYFSRFKQAWQCLTKDHIYLEELKAEGKAQADREYSSIYNMLTGYFCADWSHELPYEPPQQHILSEGDALLLCTDGLHDALESQHWLSPCDMPSLKDWLVAMQQQLRAAGAFDNVTMLILRFSYLSE